MTKDIEEVSRSVRGYLYLVLTSKFQARSNIEGNLAFSNLASVDAHQVLRSTLMTDKGRLFY